MVGQQDPKVRLGRGSRAIRSQPWAFGSITWPKRTEFWQLQVPRRGVCPVVQSLGQWRDGGDRVRRRGNVCFLEQDGYAVRIRAHRRKLAVSSCWKGWPAQLRVCWPRWATSAVERIKQQQDGVRLLSTTSNGCVYYARNYPRRTSSICAVPPQ